MDSVFVMPRVVAPLRPGRRKPRPVAAGSVLAEGARCTLIVGGPGSGKSTLLHGLAAAQPDWKPVLYRVRELGEGLEAPQDSRLVMFDGLEEAGSPDRCARMLELIAEFAGRLGGESRVLVTSRPVEGLRVDAEAWRQFELCEFEGQEVGQLVVAWARAYEPDDPAVGEKAERFLLALERHEDLYAWARSPLVLTAMTRAHFELGVSPEHRPEFYAKCVEMLLREWGNLPPVPEFARLYWEARGLAAEPEGGDLERLALEDPPERHERLRLAAEMLEGPRQERLLLKLLGRSRIELALACLGGRDGRLERLARFLAKYYWEGQELAEVTAAESEGHPVARFVAKHYWEGQELAEVTTAECAGYPEALGVLRGLLDRETRDGRSLAAAVELAEELARRGVTEARELLDAFFREAEAFGLRSVEKMAWVDGFYLDRYLVSNRDYECMAPSHRRERDRHSDADEQPVIHVNWYEAQLHCRWRGPGFRLPTDEEWEKAAAWDPATGTKRKYPWGDVFDPAKCNTAESGPGRTTPVGAYPEGASAYGCHDMAGNVWQWTASPYSADNPDPVLKSGPFIYNRHASACAVRLSGWPVGRTPWTGFRCAFTAPPRE